MRKYRPHRPHRLECGRLQGFLAVGKQCLVPTARDHYRPLSKVPPAYRPRRNVAICSSFVLDLTLAVDAVATFPAFSYVLLIAPRVSFCRNAMPMHLASDYIHPYKDAGGRPARGSVRIYLPDDMRDAPVVVCSELPNNPGGSITNSAETIAAGNPG
jgi:hypothetical protein